MVLTRFCVKATLTLNVIVTLTVALTLDLPLNVTPKLTPALRWVGAQSGRCSSCIAHRWQRLDSISYMASPSQAAPVGRPLCGSRTNLSGSTAIASCKYSFRRGKVMLLIDSTPVASVIVGYSECNHDILER